MWTRELLNDVAMDQWHNRAESLRLASILSYFEVVADLNTPIEMRKDSRIADQRLACGRWSSRFCSPPQGIHHMLRAAVLTAVGDNSLAECLTRY